MATLNLRPLPDNLHDALRLEAARRRTSIRRLVVEILERWVQQEAKWTEQVRARPASGSRRRGGRA